MHALTVAERATWQESGTVTHQVSAATIHGAHLGTLDVITGQVRMDATRAVRWDATLDITTRTLEGDPLLPLSLASSWLHPLANSRLTITLGRGASAIPCGVYVVTRAQQTGRGTIHLDLADVTRSLGPQGVYQEVSAGTPISTALRFILAQQAGLTPYRVPDGDTNINITSLISSPGEDAMGPLARLALLQRMELYADRYGTIQASLLRAATDPVWHLVEGSDCIVSDLSQTIAQDSYRNGVRVSGVTSGSSWTGTLVQANPDDPYSTAHLGASLYEVDGSIIAGNSQAASRLAHALLPHVIAANEPVEVTCAPLPMLDGDDTTWIESPTFGISGPHWVRAWTAPLGPGPGSILAHPIRPVVTRYA